MGMDSDLALKELIANSIDANAIHISINKEASKTYFIDNGRGMSKQTISNELGIQLNKNQHSHQVPKQLEKLISWCRTKCHDDLKKNSKTSSATRPSSTSSARTSSSSLIY